MTKKDQFLFIVQTAILANGTNLSCQSGGTVQYREEYSTAGVLATLDDALYASDRIPKDKTAYEAAHEFCFAAFSNLREAEEKSAGNLMSLPLWAARS